MALNASMDSNSKTPKLNEWIEEEEKVVEDVPFFTINKEGQLEYTGLSPAEKIIKHKVAYAELSSIKMCKESEHYFAFENNGKREGGRVHIKCIRCPRGGIFVPGIHQLVKGKIIRLGIV